MLCGAAAVVAAAGAWRLGRSSLRAILRESFPVLVVALVLDLAAGVIVEQQEVFLVRWPALLVLLPGYLAVGGALGGILSSRLASKLHLGLIDPTTLPGRDARREVRNMFLLGLPTFAGTAALAYGAARLGDLAGPGAGEMIGAALVGGVVAAAAAAFVAYYGTILAFKRRGASPMWISPSGSGSTPTRTAFRWSLPRWTSSVRSRWWPPWRRWGSSSGRGAPDTSVADGDPPAAPR